MGIGGGGSSGPSLAERFLLRGSEDVFDPASRASINSELSCSNAVVITRVNKGETLLLWSFNGEVNRSCEFHVARHSFLFLSVVHQLSLLYVHDRVSYSRVLLLKRTHIHTPALTPLHSKADRIVIGRQTASANQRNDRLLVIKRRKKE
jgi:hypothetical protein